MMIKASGRSALILATGLWRVFRGTVASCGNRSEQHGRGYEIGGTGCVEQIRQTQFAPLEKIMRIVNPANWR